MSKYNLNDIFEEMSQKDKDFDKAQAMDKLTKDDQDKLKLIKMMMDKEKKMEENKSLGYLDKELSNRIEGLLNQPMKKNLIFFMSDFSFGGAGNSISKLCINLPKKDYRISIICIGKCSYKKLFKRNEINVYQLKSRKLIFSIFSISNLLKKIFKKNHKNILISNIHYNNIILTFLAKQIKDLRIILVERTPLEELNRFLIVLS